MPGSLGRRRSEPPGKLAPLPRGRLAQRDRLCPRQDAVPLCARAAGVAERSWGCAKGDEPEALVEKDRGRVRINYGIELDCRESASSCPADHVGGKGTSHALPRACLATISLPDATWLPGQGRFVYMFAEPTIRPPPASTTTLAGALSSQPRFASSSLMAGAYAEPRRP